MPPSSSAPNPFYGEDTSFLFKAPDRVMPAPFRQPPPLPKGWMREDTDIGMTPNHWVPPANMPTAPTDKPPQSSPQNMALNALKAWAEWRLKQVPTAESVAQGNIPFGAGSMAGIVKGPGASTLAREAPEIFKKLDLDPRVVFAHATKNLPNNAMGMATGMANTSPHTLMQALKFLASRRGPDLGRATDALAAGFPEEGTALLHWLPTKVSEEAKLMGAMGRIPNTVAHEGIHTLYRLKNGTGFPPNQYIPAMLKGLTERASREGVLGAHPQASAKEQVVDLMSRLYMKKHGVPQ